MLGEPLLRLCQTPVGGAILCIAIITSWLGWNPLQRWKLRRIPGPFGLPFLGNLPQIATNDLTAFVHHCTRKYGPVCKVWFGSRPWVVISDPELVRKVSQSATRHRDTFSYLHVITGENRDIDRAGIFVSSGEAWRRTRRVFEASIVHPASLAAHLPSVSRCLARFLPLLEAQAGRTDPWDAAGQLGDVVLSMVGEIAYGVDFGAGSMAAAKHTVTAVATDSDADDDTTDAQSITSTTGASGPSFGSSLASSCKATFDTMRLENASCYLPLQLVLPSLQPLIRAAAAALPDAPQRRAMRARTAVAATSRQLMRAWQAQQGQGQGEHHGGPSPFREVGCGLGGSSFLAAMMAGGRGGQQGLSETEVIAQGFSFIAAGYETTSTALSLALFLLASHPEAQRRAAEEAAAVMPDGGADIELSPELLGKLPYIEAVLKETMRLYPGGSVLFREANHDVDLGGGKIAPKGVFLALATHAVHHDPALWPQPESFLPERFLAGGGGALGPAHPHAWLPFGGGARMCVGFKLAMMTSKATLAVLLRRFVFRLHEKQVLPLRTRTGLSYGPADGVWLAVSKRV